MLKIPEIDDAAQVFGDIRHMPRFYELPEPFQREWSYHPFCRAVEKWFFSGAKRDGEKLVVGERTFTAKAGVDATKALRAIGAVLRSFQPKHEHKIAAAGYMLSEWFDEVAADEKAA